MATSSPAVGSRQHTGRGFFWLGLALGVLAPVLYILQYQLRRLSVPWYMPLLGTMALVLMLAALVRVRSLWRIGGVLLLGLLAAGEWMFVLGTRLPAYTGPVAVGLPFPAFTTKWADGSPFVHAELRSDRATVMVFFRGRW